MQHNMLHNLSSGKFKTKTLAAEQKEYLEKLINYALNCLDPQQSNRFLFPKPQNITPNNKADFIQAVLKTFQDALNSPNAELVIFQPYSSKTGDLVLRLTVSMPKDRLKPKYLELHITEAPISYTSYVTYIKAIVPYKPTLSTPKKSLQIAEAIIPLPKHEEH